MTTVELSENEIANLVTACMTAKIRDGSPSWQQELNSIAEKLRAARKT